jgi:hypothetical protein
VHGAGSHHKKISEVAKRSGEWMVPRFSNQFAGRVREMPRRSLHKANGSKQAQRLAALGRRKQRLNRLAKGEPIIPEGVLRKLSNLNLPPNPWVYQVCLRELLGGLPAMDERGSCDGSAVGELKKV